MLAGTHPVDWFEIPTTDLARATRFYEALLDIEMQSLDLGELRYAFFPMEEGAPNGTGALVHHAAMYTPSHDGAVVYIGVSDLDGVLSRVEGLGGRILQGRKQVGEFGFVAFLEDSEGNRIGLHAKR